MKILLKCSIKVLFDSVVVTKRKLPYILTSSDGSRLNGRAHHVFVARVSGQHVRGLHYMDIAFKIKDQTYEFHGENYKCGEITRTIVRPNKARKRRSQKSRAYDYLSPRSSSESSDSLANSESSDSSESSQFWKL